MKCCFPTSIVTNESYVTYSYYSLCLLSVLIMGEKSVKPHCFKNMKCYTNKKVWMTTAIFKKFLWVMNAPIGVQVRNILLFEDNCATHLQDRSFIQTVIFVHDAFYEDQILLDSEKNADFSSYVCVDNELWPHVAFPAWMSCAMIVNVGRKREMNMTLNY